MSEEKILRDYAREPVPLSQRKSWVPLSLVWVAIGIDLSAIMLGAQLGAGMTLFQAMISVLIGSMVLAIIGGVCSYIGASAGLSTAMITRYAFGEWGSRLVSVIIGISLLGWFGVQAGFFGVSSQIVVSEVVGLEMPIWLLSLIGGLLMTTTAVFGYRAIEKLSVWAVPLMVGLFLFAVYFAFTRWSFGEIMGAVPVEEPLSIGLAISYVIGIFLVGTVISPDVARWAKSRRDAVLSSVFGFFFGNSIMLFIAIILSRATGTEDLAEIFILLGLGVPALLILILSQWTTNDNNLYSASLGFSVVFRDIPKSWLTVVAGLIGTTLAVMDIYGNFILFLTHLTVLISPIGGIYIAEYFFFDRDRFRFTFIRQQKLPNWMPRSLVTWLLASAVAFSTTPAPDGFGLWTLTTIPALDGLLSALLLQVLLGKLGNFRGKPSQTAEAEGA
ncbi:cytosine permease [Desmospora profundinema]|uniref:Cytosine permease n=1 Tax=Desmospora profundinema TaxID=1571184 RepID=A0ABU1IIU0_9BACL|nr:cytosine permease [Desmospora profundinema]MDR6224687.1 cytosine permease [Desmospora profundinema]